MVARVSELIPLVEDLWNRIVNPSGEKLGRRILSILVFAESIVSIFWIYTISALGEAYAMMAATPYAYLIFSYISLFVFYRTKRYHYFIFTQLVMLLVMPFFLQWTIGGFEAAGGVAIWALLSPIGAMMILGTRKSTAWFLLFIILAAISWKLNYLFASTKMPMPTSIKDTFFLMNIIGTASILYAAMRFFQGQKERILEALEFEQNRSDKLLLNILPESIALRLKNGNESIADSHPCVTILFADIVGFTELSSRLSPFELVNLLSGVFSKFDSLAKQHQLEKIKTLGDGYMVVGGAPVVLNQHAQAVANFAIQMLQALHQFNQETGNELHMRIGISSGPVVAGVIGTTKFAYDMWGDTVNMASRMEQTGPVDEIHVSESTYQLLKEQYLFDVRENTMIKGKGNLNTYLLRFSERLIA